MHRFVRVEIIQISSNGNHANISSNGNHTSIESSGQNSVINCAGHDSRVKAKKGSWITLTEWNESKDVTVCIKTECVDGDRIKEDTWYRIENGEFVEWKP